MKNVLAFISLLIFLLKDYVRRLFGKPAPKIIINKTEDTITLRAPVEKEPVPVVRELGISKEKVYNFKRRGKVYDCLYIVDLIINKRKHGSHIYFKEKSAKRRQQLFSNSYTRTLPGYDILIYKVTNTGISL